MHILKRLWQCVVAWAVRVWRSPHPLSGAMAQFVFDAREGLTFKE